MRAVRVGRTVSVEGRVRPTRAATARTSLSMLSSCCRPRRPPPRRRRRRRSSLTRQSPFGRGPARFFGSTARVDLIDDCDGVARLAVAMDGDGGGRRRRDGGRRHRRRVAAARVRAAGRRDAAARAPPARYTRPCLCDRSRRGRRRRRDDARAGRCTRPRARASALAAGFCAADDFSRLARTPGLGRRRRRRRPCSICSRAPAKSSAARSARRRSRGTCTALLGVGLDKAQQQSDWGARPLTDAQLRYAALDAFCLPLLYDALEALPPAGSTMNDAPPPPPDSAPGAGAAAGPPAFNAAPTVVSTAVVLRAPSPSRRAASGGRAATRTDCVRLICRESGEAEAAAAEVVSKERAARPSGRAAARRSTSTRRTRGRAAGGIARRFDVLFWRDRATDDQAPTCAGTRAALAVPDGRRRRRRGGFTAMGPGHGAAAPTDASEHIVWRLRALVAIFQAPTSFSPRPHSAQIVPPPRAGYAHQPAPPTARKKFLPTPATPPTPRRTCTRAPERRGGARALRLRRAPRAADASPRGSTSSAPLAPTFNFAEEDLQPVDDVIFGREPSRGVSPVWPTDADVGARPLCGGWSPRYGPTRSSAFPSHKTPTPLDTR